MAGTPTESVSRATVDIGRTFVEGGFLGLVLYAVILVIFLLLIRDFLKDLLIRSVSREQTETNKAVAAALAQMAVQLSIMQSASGWAEWQRARDKKLLPGGELPRNEEP